MPPLHGPQDAQGTRCDAGMRTWTVDEEDERILLDAVPVLEIGDYCDSAEDNLPLLRFVADACNERERRLADASERSARILKDGDGFVYVPDA